MVRHRIDGFRRKWSTDRQHASRHRIDGLETVKNAADPPTHVRPSHIGLESPCPPTPYVSNPLSAIIQARTVDGLISVNARSLGLATADGLGNKEIADGLDSRQRMTV